jgi:hypothetical protein
MQRCWQVVLVVLLAAAAGAPCTVATRLQDQDDITDLYELDNSLDGNAKATSTRNSTMLITGPLAPWAPSSPPPRIGPLPSCMVLQGAGWGVGSAWNNILWSAVFLRSELPAARLFYDHTASHHTCSPLGTLDELLAPRGELIRAGLPDKEDLPCTPMNAAYTIPLLQKVSFLCVLTQCVVLCTCGLSFGGDFTCSTCTRMLGVDCLLVVMSHTPRAY